MTGVQELWGEGVWAGSSGVRGAEGIGACELRGLTSMTPLAVPFPFQASVSPPGYWEPSGRPL